ncbi:MAG: DUF547 domain-containing protein [Acidobacteria bacterium]|nr:DUF547 domain-containing protein [Acidobacteriota bacterium]
MTLSTPRTALATLALLALLAPVAAPAAAVGFSHDAWTAVLERFVDANGLVDYRSLSGDRAQLDRYLEALAAASPDSAPERFKTDAERLAYWLNAYNALVFQGVLARGPESESVWGDGLFGLGFFTAERHVLGGSRYSLKRLEDDVIRARFRDPRVHAALNCASLGCPRLPRRAFQGATLDVALDAALREFVADPRNCRVDAARRTVTLSKIFDWFEDDFLDRERRIGDPRPRLLDFVNRYRDPRDLVPRDFRVRFADYDKRINRQP